MTSEQNSRRPFFEEGGLPEDIYAGMLGSHSMGAVSGEDSLVTKKSI